jgi:multicomponent Na+:H+ antiporter subunit B
MTRHQIRGLIALPFLAVVAALLVWGMADIPGFGHYRGPYGDVLNRIAVPQRHTTNVVGATVFDYRGVDTMGEEFILFGAVLGVVLLLRSRSAAEAEQEEQQEEEVVDPVTSEALRWAGMLMVGVALTVGIWLVAFGYVTPGGGFQGGVTIAGALLLLYVAASFRSWRRVSKEEVLDPVEGIGVGGYGVVGLAALVSALPFLHNLLPPGETGTLKSGGSIAFLNAATALEVFAANVVLCAEFLKQYVRPIARRRERR